MAEQILGFRIPIGDWVEAGEPIARLTNPFGDVIREYTAPEAGIVIGHSVNPVGSSGARILHLGIPAAENSPLRNALMAEEL